MGGGIKKKGRMQVAKKKIRIWFEKKNPREASVNKCNVRNYTEKKIKQDTKFDPIPW